MNKEQCKLVRAMLKQTMVRVYKFHSNPDDSKISKKFLDEAISGLKDMVDKGVLPKNPRIQKSKLKRKKRQ